MKTQNKPLFTKAQLVGKMVALAEVVEDCWSRLDFVSLAKILRQGKPSISWGLQRLISVPTYVTLTLTCSGTVKLMDLLQTFFSMAYSPSYSLQQRIDILKLWNVLESLTHASLLCGQNMLVYSWLLFGKEFRPWCRACAGDPLTRILGGDSCGGKYQIGAFSPREFQTLFPEQEPVSRMYGSKTETWCASLEQMQEAIQKCK